MGSYNIVGHCYNPSSNNDKVYMLCIRKESNPGAMDTWEVISKWGRRGKTLSSQSKGKHASESMAYQARENLWHDLCKKGYMDITSNAYIAHMLKLNSPNQPLRMDMKEIKDNLEAEPGQAKVAPKVVIWQCESCGKDWNPKLNENGFPDNTQNNLCPSCHEKMARIAKKHQENGGDMVMFCVDNTGMEDRFDLDIEYIVENHKDKAMIYAYDKMGRKDEYFRLRFITPEQWNQKKGKIKVNVLKNRTGGKKLEFKALNLGDKIRMIRPNLDVELTEDQIKKLIEHRGGCTCHTGHPPCQACTEPITADEYEELGFGEIEAAIAPRKHFSVNINGEKQ